MPEAELQTAVEPVEQSESAPDTEIEGVEPTETVETKTTDEDVPNDRYAKRINKVYGEAREAERQAETLRQENAQLRAQLPQEQRPVVPEAPDPYDADYTGKLKDYTEAVGKVATFDTLQQGRIEAENRQNYEAQQKLQKTWIDRAQSYTERATELNITTEQLQSAGKIVAAYGLKDEVTGYIMDRKKDGPTVALYLAANQEELSKVSHMTTAEASVYVDTVISPKAAASSGKSGAPDPAESISGGGAPPTQRGPKGATYT